jgi:predicted site-specific integrase-resolvase
MNLPEFLEEYRLPKRTARDLIRKGLLPVTKVTAKTFIFNRAAVEAALAKLTIGGAV